MTPEKIFRSIALWIPLGVVAICLLAQTTALPFLPAEIISKWSFEGTPTEWRPAWEAIVFTGGFGVGASVVLYLVGARTARHSDYRLYAALIWLLLMLSVPTMSVIVVGQVWITGLDIGQAFLASLVTAIACAVAAATSVPSSLVTTQDPDPAQWSRSTAADRLALRATFNVSMNAFVGVVSVIAAAFDALWWVPASAIVISAFSSTRLITIARIDARGVAVRSPLGLPRTIIPLADIESVDITTIDAVVDLGRIGWNTRIGRPQEGVAIRSGEGLRIRRRHGADFLLATDDAGGAEAILRSQLAAERTA